MTEDEVRQVLLTAFPDWLQRLFACAPLSLSNDKVVIRSLRESSVAGEEMEMISRLTERQVVFADEVGISSNVYAKVAGSARGLITSLCQIELVADLLGKDVVAFGKIPGLFAGNMALACLSVGGEFEAYRNGNPLWYPVGRPDDGYWALNFVASRIRWSPFGLSEHALAELCRFLRGRKLDIVGVPCVCGGIPKDLAEVDDFVIKFVKVKDAPKD